MKVVRRRGPYSKIITVDVVEQEILFAYCEGKSYIWNIYLGWRSCAKDNCMTFWIPTKSIKELEISINNIKRSVDDENQIL